MSNVSDNKKDFYMYVFSKSQTEENRGLLLKEKGDLAAEMMNIFSVFFALLLSNKICSKAEKCKVSHLEPEKLCNSSGWIYPLENSFMGKHLRS